MDYKEKYENALERARKLKNKLEKNCSLATPTGIESIFPELAVSEDERIRKELIRLLNVIADGIIENYTPIPLRDLVAWLEKQDKKNPADKVEPKFKVGDWVVYNRNDYSSEIRQVYDIRDGLYYFTDNVHFSWSVKECDEKAHLWTIEDAKDGDVLACESGERTLECLFIFKLIADREVLEYCSYRTIDKHFSLKDSFLGYVDNVYHPATKEQRDILFSKMKEAGYEWDFDKKELRKIDDYCKENCKGFQETRKCYADGECKAKREAELNPAWSDDDELRFKKAIYIFHQNGYFDVENWLKSLKDRVQPHWKPTEEQLMALRDAIDNNEMESLYNDLKKL